VTVTTGRRCANPSCRRRLGETSRPDKVYCSPACRVAAHERRRGEREEEAARVLDVPELEAVLARATTEERLLAQIAGAAAKGQWRASAWILERRFPERWAARPRPPAESESEPKVADDSVFAEVDEIAQRRAKHRGARRRERRPDPRCRRSSAREETRSVGRAVAVAQAETRPARLAGRSLDAAAEPPSREIGRRDDPGGSRLAARSPDLDAGRVASTLADGSKSPTALMRVAFLRSFGGSASGSVAPKSDFGNRPSS
jgi:hypothetical protein